jgi:threonine/homoserine efflux transporter RhtA
MEQELQLSHAKNVWHRTLRLAFYIVSGIMAAFELFSIIALSVIKVSCRFYYSGAYQLFEKITPFMGLAVLPLFIWHVTISAQKRQWRHLGISIAIFLLLIVGLYMILLKSMFYCFLDQIPDEFFYWGPH